MEENRSRVADAISSLPPSVVEEMEHASKKRGMKHMQKRIMTLL